MIRLKKVFIFIAVMSMFLAGCGSKETDTDTKIIKIAHYAGSTHPLSISLEEKFKAMVEENSKGTLKVEIYGDGKLGSEAEYFSVLRSGSIQMAVNGTIMTNEVPQVDVVGLPFLFDNLEQAQKVLTSTVATEIAPNFEEKLGLHVLGFGSSGFRVFTSNREINTMEDFKGLKLRTSEGYEVATKTGQALQANVTPLPFNELFTSIEQGVIDAQENPLATIISGKIYEVQDYVLITRHILANDIITINNEFWESLTDKEQEVIEEAVNATVENIWALLKENEVKDIEYLKEKGLKVSEVNTEFKTDLRNAVESVYDWYFNKNPWAQELVEKIEAAK